MRRLSSLVKRGSGALALLLQLFVVGVVPVVDARAEAAGVGEIAHVEEFGSTRCPPTHDALDCQLCRGLRTPFVAAPALACPAAERSVSELASGQRDAAVPFVLAGGVSPRAPPAA